MHFIITTPVNRHYDGMWEVQWAVGDCRIMKTRYKGLFLMEAEKEALQKIRDYDTTAICRVIPLDALVEADLQKMTEETLSLTQKKLEKGKTFAVRCNRRGFHVPSKEIEKEIGAQIKEKAGNPVNLDNPDTLVLIEIIDKKAGIAVLKESEILKKETVDL